MVLTSCIPGISNSFLMVSLLISFLYGSYTLYSRDLQFFSYGFASYFVSIWFLHLVFQGSPVLFLWFRFLFCFYMVLTSCIPGISSFFLRFRFLFFSIWFLHLVFQGSPVLFLWFRVLFCLYMVPTSCIPGIFSFFLVISLLILSSLVYPVTLLRQRICAASRPVMSLFVVTHVSLPYSSDGLATTL